MRRICGTVIGWSLLFAAVTPSNVFADRIVSSGTTAAILGKGYHSKNQDFRGDCLAYNPAKVIRVGAPSATVVFTRSLTASELQDSLGFSANTRARYGVTEASAAAEFAREATSSQYSETTTYVATYSFKNAYLYEADLSPFAKALLGSGPFVTDNFVQTCGDQFVEQVELGAKLLINARIDFATSSDRQRFAAELSIQGPAFSLGTKLQQASSRLSRSASVTISAFQLGGSVDRLSTIFSRGSATSASGHTHAILTCSMSDVEPCLKVLTSALDYATSPDSPDGFPQQFKTQFDPSTGEGGADLAYITRPWSSRGLQVPPQIVTDAINAHRASLAAEMEVQLKFKTRLDSLKYEALRLSPEQNVLADQYRVFINQNVDDLFKAAITCYTDDILCPKAAAGATEALIKRKQAIKFDPAFLDIVPQTFAQWCDFAGYQATVPRPALASTRRTVEALIRTARQNMVKGLDDEVWGKVGDQCQFAQDILAQLKQIGFADEQITDLRPITALKNIESLILHGNTIDDIALKESAIGELPNLLRLDLARNSIANAAILTSLQKLVSLDLSSNHLADASALKALTNLKLLNLSDNPLKSQRCPLANSELCVF